MRLRVLILVFFFLHGFVSVYSQQTRLSIKIENASLEEVFDRISSVSDFLFIYNVEEVKDIQNLTFDLRDVEVEKILDQVLKNVDFDYKVVDNVVVITPSPGKTREINERTASTESRKVIFKGTVKDEQGLPLPFASVIIKGTTIGTAASVLGEFEIEVPEGEYKTLVISSIGYATQAIEIGDKLVFDIRLQIDIAQLSEVVATGYQTLPKERVTGSYGQIKSDVLDKELTANIFKKLEGKISGLLIGKDNSIQIRGQSTMNGEQSPLFVIDGMPTEGLSTVDPNDILSVDVLKDASAASIWGTRAANGVIVITTKGGQRQSEPTTVNVNFSTIIKSTNNISDLQLANSSDMVDFEFDAFINRVFNPIDLERNLTPISPVYQLMKDIPSDLNQQLDSLRKLDHSDQVKKYLMQKSVNYQANVAIQSSSDKNLFYISFNGIKSQGSMIGNDSYNMNINLKNSYQISKKLSFSFNSVATLYASKNNGVSSSSVVNRKPYEMILGENGEYLPQAASFNQEEKEYYMSLGYLDWNYNLKKEIDNMDNTNDIFSNRLISSVEYNPIAGLSLSSSFLYSLSRSTNRSYASQNVYSTANIINTYALYDDVTGLINHQFPLGGVLRNNNGVSNSYTFRNVATYKRDFKGGDHRFSALAGFEARETNFSGSNMISIGYDDQSLSHSIPTYTIIDENGRPVQAYLMGSLETFYGETKIFPFSSYLESYSYNKHRDLSYFANFGYTLYDKYSFTASGRIDKASIFGVDERYRNNPLWSIGVKWNMKKEGFLPGVINRLDFRTSYGFVGNIAPGVYSYATARYRTSFQAEQYLEMQSPKNNSLTFEKTAILNLGIDFAFFKNKISGSIDAYSKKSDGLLGSKQNDMTTGWITIFSNYAKASNKGIEIDLRYNAISTSDLNLTLGVNFSTVKNEVDFVYSPYNRSPNYLLGGSAAARQGMPMSALYNYRDAGLDAAGEYLTYDAEGNIVVGANAYTLQYEDLVYSGQTDPTFFGGFSADVQYRKFNLIANFTFKGGHVARMPVPNYTSAASISNTHTSITDRWQNPGDEHKPGILPGLGSDNILMTAWRVPAFYRDNRVFDASLIRFRSLVLSYSANFTKNQKYKVNIFYEMRNIAVMTKNNLGIDPDFINAYSGNLTFREPRSYSIGIKSFF